MSKRKQQVEIFQKIIEEKCLAIDRASWAKQFSLGYTDTLEKTMQIQPEKEEVFVLTGDIPAMWLRDSTCQVVPYLPLAKEHTDFAKILGDLVTTQCRYILNDPYANAFNLEANGAGHQDDLTEMNPLIWERKFEIDSLCYPIWLAYRLYKECGYDAHFTETFYQAVEAAIEVFQTEQHHESSPYSFERLCDRQEDTLKNQGKGTPVKETGLIWSGFRPSDDACTYGYLIPSNMFAVTILGQLEEILPQFYPEAPVLAQVKQLKSEVQQGIEEYAIITDEETGKQLFAYEVDGFGNYVLMDDANVPSLISLPYLGYCSPEDERYQNTRAFLLSERNPYYYQGQYLQGIGSSHTPESYVWPIALAIQGLTSTDKAEKMQLLDTIVATDNGTNQCHESIDVDNPANYTREWFSWSNMMFCQLVLNYFEID